MIQAQQIRRTALWMGVVLPLAALLGTIWVTHETNGQFSAAFASVTQAYKTLNVLAETQTHISDAETGRRGYLLTGQNDYFESHDTAMATVNNDIQKLKFLTAGNPGQQASLADLENLVARRLALQPGKIAPGKTGADGPLAITLTDEGRDIMNQIRVLLYQMREQETELLTARQQNAEARFLFDQTTSLVLVGVTAIALIAIVTILIRLEKLRQIVTVCAWTGQVQHDGEWMRLDEYLKRRFGLSVSHGLSREASEKMKRDHEQRHAKESPPAG